MVLFITRDLAYISATYYKGEKKASKIFPFHPHASLLSVAFIRAEDELCLALQLEFVHCNHVANMTCDQ